MRTLVRICLAACLLCVAQLVQASQDVLLPISEVRLSSPGTKEIGPIVITTNLDPAKYAGDTTWLSLEVEAFGKKFKLDDKQLAQLKGYPLASLILKYGPYAQTGDEHSFQIAVSTSKQDGNMTIDTIVSITVSNKHDVTVDKPYETAFVPNPPETGEKK